MNLGTKEEYVARYKDSLGDRAEQAGKSWEHLVKATKGKDTAIIPKGDYCYTLEESNSSYRIPNFKYCPYMTTKEYNGVKQPYCGYLEWGGIDNYTTEEEYAKLLEYFGSEEKISEELPLFLLFDSCKECGENMHTPEEEEEMYKEFINKEFTNGNSNQKES